MVAVATTGSLTNLQMEILKLYSTEMSETELYELKLLLSEYYAKRAINEADILWDKYNLSDEHMEDWLNEN